MLLEDKGDEATKRPGLVEFWAQADNALLREEFEKLRDEVRFGDPLYVAKALRQGPRGRVPELGRALRGTTSRASAGPTTRRS